MPIHPRRRQSSAEATLRIIAGNLRHRLIRFPAQASVRPTPERVRETLFNWLGQTLDGQTCLDLFAGSGALGFEAYSRGAAKVVLLEPDRISCAALTRNAQTLQANVEIQAISAENFLARDPRRFDIIFFDPPFASDYYTSLWPAIGQHLAPQGQVYVESPRPFEADGWAAWRAKRAGNVFYQLMVRE